MAIFDTWSPLSDSDTLSNGQTVKFRIYSQCVPLGRPSTDEVASALGSAAASLSVVSVTEPWEGAVQVVTGGDIFEIQANVNEVISVGNLKAQIAAVSTVINTSKVVPCSSWKIDSNEIDLLIERGDGTPAASWSIPTSLIAAAIIAVVGFLVWREVSRPL